MEEALEGRLDRVERKLAVKELRRLIEALAFEFSIRKGHVYPRDIDYALALEGLRSPEDAADVLARNRPRYRRRKTKRRVRLVAVLLVLGLVVYTVAALATSEVSEPVHAWSHGEPEATTTTVTETFNVTGEYQRLDLEMWVWVTSDRGSVSVTVLNPDNEAVVQDTWTRRDGAYDRGNLPAMQGTWRVVVDYRDAVGSVTIDVNGVRPAP